MKLDKKQKIMLVITLLAFAFLTWQVYDLVAGDVGKSRIASHKSASTRAKRVAARKDARARKNAANGNAATLHAAPVVSQPKLAQTPASESNAYIHMANQLEMAKMEGQLIGQQITVAKARKELQSVGGASRFGEPSYSSDNSAASGIMQLTYVGQLNGVWQAVVLYNGQYSTVSAGQQLPNGAMIKSIDRQGVTYRQAGRKRRLNFSGIRTLVNPATTNAASTNPGSGTETMKAIAKTLSNTKQKLALRKVPVDKLKSSQNKKSIW